jgi:hypothetical protein
VRFDAITLCVTSQRVFIVVSVYFVIDSVRKLLDTPAYVVMLLRPADLVTLRMKTLAHVLPDLVS